MANIKLSTWIVEDEPLALAMLKSYVDKTEMLELSMVFNSPSDLALALDNNRVADLVFMDLNIGNGKALDCIPVVQRHCRFLIITTAYFPAVVRRELDIDWRGIGFLHKPFSYRTFLSEVERLVREGPAEPDIGHV
ncbi:MAG: response regulator [Chitinophagaceae bacterium]